MRIAVVYYFSRNKKNIEAISESLVEGLKSQGHDVDLININETPGKKLTIYNYIALGVESESFFRTKISDKIPGFLSNSGIIRGKRSYSYTNKLSLRPQKVLRNLMKVMEYEGMYLKKSDVIGSVNEAKLIGKKLHIS